MDYDFTYTGAEIQEILDTAKKLKDSGYIFLGVATPSTNPGTPTQKVYYEAKQAGTYTNFGGVVLPDGISLLKWNGSWTSETVMCGDGGVFDISVYKSSGGTLAKYTDLAAALGTNGANIPSSLRKGGMSVKFVQSSDNKYVQFRLKMQSFSDNVKDWEDDNVVDTSDIFFNDASLDVADESDNVILRLQQGHIKTKNFDSAENNRKVSELEQNINTERQRAQNVEQNLQQDINNLPSSFPVNTAPTELDETFAISDEQNHDIIQFNNGHVKTKNFDSAENNAKLAEIEQEIGAIPVASGLSESPLAISDENDNDIVRFDAGHVRTKNFNSKNAKINYYLKRPQTGKHCFSVSVNCYLFTLNNSLTKQDQEVIGTDYGFIAIPKNYSPTGEPTRLIIYCHGSGAVLSDYQNPNAVNWAAHYECWLKLGYAFMDMYAAPTQFTGSTTELHLGNPTVLQCYRKGYEYVQRHFNIKRDGIFVIGASMGGLSSLQICMSGMFPVIGYVGYCPCCDLYKQAYLGQWDSSNRQKIANFFNFAGKDQVTFTSGHIGTAEERQLFKDNIEKWKGFNPMLLHADNDLAQQILSFVPSLDDSESWNTEEDQAEAQTYKDLKIHFPVPAKVFHCVNDTSVLYRYSKYFVDAIRRGGGQAWFRPLPSGGHSAWAAGDDVSVVGIDGQSFTMKASTYEAYLFVKRINNN